MEIKKNYKIVASDLDGTLLNSQSQISRENMQAIGELARKGIQFVPASGRTLSELHPQIRNNPDIRYYIYSNGAVVLDTQTGRHLNTCIPNWLVRKVMDVLMNYDFYLTLRWDGRSLVDPAQQNPEGFAHYNVFEPHKDCVFNYAEFCDDLVKTAYEADNVEVFSVFFHSGQDGLACRARLEALGNLRIVQLTDYYIEVMHIDAGKGNALHSLADLLGIDRGDTISIGDSDNDCTITQAAGLGLAVSNACEKLKAIADQTICSNDEHVVEYVLRHFC